MKTTTFANLVTTFLNLYIIADRGLSPNTRASYSDCIKLLILHLCEKNKIKPEAVTIEMIDKELVTDFLHTLEEDRNNKAATRNQRLAAIKSFFHFAVNKRPDLMFQNECIQAIKSKKTDYKPPPSMSIEEVETILSVPNTETLLGTRDKAIIQLLYNSGCRVQELVDLTLSELHFDGAATVTLTRKGQKTRVLPSWQETVEILTHYLEFRKREGIVSDHLFLNNRGEVITRFGVGKMVKKYAKIAAQKCPSLIDCNITPHVFRHTTALHLLEATGDLGCHS